MKDTVKELLQKLKVNSQAMRVEREHVGVTEGNFNTSENLEQLYDERKTILHGLTDALDRKCELEREISMKEIKVKCEACEKVSFKREWKKAEIKKVNGEERFVGGCPHCHGEFYEEVK